MQLVANIAHVSLGAELDTRALLRTSTPALKAASVALPQRKRKFNRNRNSPLQRTRLYNLLKTMKKLQLHQHMVT